MSTLWVKHDRLRDTENLLNIIKQVYIAIPKLRIECDFFNLLKFIYRNIQQMSDLKI